MVLLQTQLSQKKKYLFYALVALVVLGVGSIILQILMKKASSKKLKLVSDKYKDILSKAGIKDF